MKRILALVMLLTVLLGCMLTPSGAFAATAVKSIKINGGNVTLTVGQTKQLSVTFNPSNASNKKITWSSSNTKVATVSSNGLVTAKSSGSVTITAKASNGKTAKTSLEVAKQVAVTKVSINRTSVSMTGKPVKLTATCIPQNSNQKVSWSSSNNKIATVTSDGTVTPKGYGTCTITAKSNNGKTATCTIKVDKSYTITKKVTWAEEGPYKIQDTYRIVVDGLTGKIKSNDCQQYSRDTVLLGVISEDGIKAYNVTDTYIDFRSTYTVRIGAGIGGIKVGIKAVTSTRLYRMDNQGNITQIGGDCNDLLNLCNR